MRRAVLAAFFALCTILTGTSHISAEILSAQPQDINFSPNLRALLKDEMHEVASEMQTIVVALASANWKTVQDSSDKIRASYVMEKKLTPDQEKELARLLPEHFKQLDIAFHRRAANLAAAASEHDAKLAVFHYGQLVESCTTCHAVYARSRFPGFASPTRQKPLSLNNDEGFHN